MMHVIMSLIVMLQTNPDALKGFNVARVLGQEGLQLYRGGNALAMTPCVCIRAQCLV